jgi:hypothetical protein
MPRSWPPAADAPGFTNSVPLTIWRERRCEWRPARTSACGPAGARPAVPPGFGAEMLIRGLRVACTISTAGPQLCLISAGARGEIKLSRTGPWPARPKTARFTVPACVSCTAATPHLEVEVADHAQKCSLLIVLTTSSGFGRCRHVPVGEEARTPCERACSMTARSAPVAVDVGDFGDLGGRSAEAMGR